MLNDDSSGAGATWFSSRKIIFCIEVQPGPPYSFGQDIAAQPRLLRMRCQATVSCLRRAVAETHALADVGGQVVADEGAHLVAERQLFRGEAQVHGRSSY